MGTQRGQPRAPGLGCSAVCLMKRKPAWACRARMCCFQGRAPKPPSAGFPTSRAEGTPGTAPFCLSTRALVALSSWSATAVRHHLVLCAEEQLADAIGGAGVGAAKDGEGEFGELGKHSLHRLD